jgi:hypothetical protein
MANKTTVDFVTYDPRSDEFVLYLVEDGPWPSSDSEWRKCLKAIQDHILEVVDSAVDGGVAKKFPDSKGKPIRIQLDAPHGTPVQVEELVAGVRRFLADDQEYRKAIGESSNIKGLRLVTGKELGRFQGDKRPG